MGDFNSKVGTDNTYFCREMGRHGCGVMNENGERMANFCALNNLVIGGTLFEHRDIHKLTWYSPNDRDKNQIDHILINGKWRRSLQDVRVRRGADVGSDHQLVVAKIKLKLKRHHTKSKNIGRKYDIDKLSDCRTKAAFSLELKNRFRALQEQTQEEENTGNVDSSWTKVKDIYKKASEKCLGFKLGQKKKPWIQQETWEAIEERRKIKKRVIDSKSERLRQKHKSEYSESLKKVKRLARRDKRQYVDDLAKQAQEAADKGKQGDIFRITKQICGKFCCNSSGPVKDKFGKLLTTEQEIESRWTEHFQELLNRPEPENLPDIETAKEDLDINTAPPTKEEIIHTIKALKNRKAPGKDNINAELLKADPEAATTILIELFEIIWREEDVPSDWNEGKIVKIPKKGTLSDCNNWRGITLLSVPSKVLAKIIISRISETVDKVLRKEQAGFRKHKGCIDQIFALRNIIEQCTEWQRRLYINFIDFQKAFDSIHRDSLWKILRHYGIPPKIVNLIKSFYRNFSCTVGESNINFQVKTGVRQGCVMSSTLFNLAIDWVMRRTTEDYNRGIRWTLLSSLDDLDFADDLALVSHTHNHIQEKTDRLCAFGGQIGLKVNQKKTETMLLNVDNPTHIQAYGTDLPTTDQFTYLGSIVRKDGGAETDIRSRLNKARNVMRSMNNIWKSTQYSKYTKLKLYTSCVLATLMYGSECWRMTKSDAEKLSAFHTTCLRRILRIFWPNKITNSNLLQQCNTVSMDNLITRRRWRWIGHVLRMQPDAIPRVALHWTPEGKRRRGRPKQTWRRTVEKEIKEWGQSWTTIKRLADNRDQWKNFVAALHASGRQG